MVILTVTPTGIEDTRALSKFRIYPNPSNGIITVRINTVRSSTALIKVQDIFGKVVFESSARNGIMNLNLSDYSSGIYLVSLEDDGTQSTKSLIIQK
ncbi:MAG TPA: T9SS type A sorting domain-containing protein [Flavobacteriales bacterium]|nr:T9SS type A sorting domain-containing protein [Flavobacteriales bacterium]